MRTKATRDRLRLQQALLMFVLAAFLLSLAALALAQGGYSLRWGRVDTGTSPSPSIAATGKHVHSAGCSVFHFRDGKVVEQ